MTAIERRKFALQAIAIVERARLDKAGYSGTYLDTARWKENNETIDQIIKDLAAWANARPAKKSRPSRRDTK